MLGRAILRRLGAGVLAVAAATPALAVEIAPPAPLTADIGDPDGRTLLARWTGRPAPVSERQLVGATSPRSGRRVGSPILGLDGRPAVAAPLPYGRRLSPTPLVLRAEPRPGGGFGVLLAVDELGAPAAFTTSATFAGTPRGTRFDVRPEDRNPIAFGGDVVDEITTRVVKTPEPGTLALFALGAAAFAALVARRRT